MRDGIQTLAQEIIVRLKGSENRGTGGACVLNWENVNLDSWAPSVEPSRSEPSTSECAGD